MFGSICADKRDPHKKARTSSVVGDIRRWEQSLYYSHKASKSDRVEVLHKSFDILDQLNKSYTLLHQ